MDDIHLLHSRPEKKRGCSFGERRKVQSSRVFSFRSPHKKHPNPVFFDGIVWPMLAGILMGDFGLAAGEVLFAEVLVTPTGVSKGCGYVMDVHLYLLFF